MNKDGLNCGTRLNWGSNYSFQPERTFSTNRAL
jgi:hypothetical protein